jgi:hypothetical protein
MQQHAQPSQSATQQSQAPHSSPSSTALTLFEHSRPRREQQETPNMTNDPPKMPHEQEPDHPCSNANQKTNTLPQQQKTSKHIIRKLSHSFNLTKKHSRKHQQHSLTTCAQSQHATTRATLTISNPTITSSTLLSLISSTHFDRAFTSALRATRNSKHDK